MPPVRTPCSNDEAAAQSAPARPPIARIKSTNRRSNRFSSGLPNDVRGSTVCAIIMFVGRLPRIGLSSSQSWRRMLPVSKNAAGHTRDFACVEYYTQPPNPTQMKSRLSGAEAAAGTRRPARHQTVQAGNLQHERQPASHRRGAGVRL